MDDLLIALTCVVPLVIYFLWTKGQGLHKARYACVGLGLAFCYFALGHFVVTDELVQMMPPWVPQRRLLIHVTGCLEILIAAGLFTERWRGLAAVASAFVLIAFFPANIYAAIHHVGVGEHQQGPQYLWVRTPLQLFLLAWALWPCRLKVRNAA